MIDSGGEVAGAGFEFVILRPDGRIRTDQPGHRELSSSEYGTTAAENE